MTLHYNLLQYNLITYSNVTKGVIIYKWDVLEQDYIHT